MKKLDRITIRLNQELIGKFKKYCDEHNKNMSTVLRDFISDLSDFVEIPDSEYLINRLWDCGEYTYRNKTQLKKAFGITDYMWEKNQKEILKIYERLSDKSYQKIID